MMKFLKNLQKSIKAHHLLFLGLVVAVVAVALYSSHKSTVMDMMSTNNKEAEANKVQDAVQTDMGVKPSAPLGENEGYAKVHGLQSRDAGMSNCSKQAMQDPASLLPKDENSEWARLNPSGNGTLDNVNLLKSGYHIGIDTVGNTLRNANLQVRSEPANPQVNVGPWNNTTIAPDLMRVPLEIGCGSQ
tara:strand:- start:3209 stop:3772 length:564 start_codon:yes stop_codon:yes gene_type:complete